MRGYQRRGAPRSHLDSYEAIREDANGGFPDRTEGDPLLGAHCWLGQTGAVEPCALQYLHHSQEDWRWSIGLSATAANGQSLYGLEN